MARLLVANRDAGALPGRPGHPSTLLLADRLGDQCVHPLAALAAESGTWNSNSTLSSETSAANDHSSSVAGRSSPAAAAGRGPFSGIEAPLYFRSATCLTMSTR